MGFPGVPGQAGSPAEGSEDSVTLSPEAKKLSANGRTGGAKTDPDVSNREQAEIDRLKETDRRVRVHEQAHMAAAGTLAEGPPQFQYVTGPDGKQYAVGGEVHIDTSTVRGDPAATVQKARQIEQAALAPSDPSPQDRQVASEAAAMIQAAEAQLASKKSADSGNQLNVFA